MSDPYSLPDTTIHELMDLIEAARKSPESSTCEEANADLSPSDLSGVGANSPEALAAIQIEFECTPTMHYALVHSGIPVVRRVAIVNRSDAVLENATLDVCLRAATIAPDVARLTLPLPSLPPGKSIRLTDPKLTLDPAIFVQLDEAVSGEFITSVSCDGVEMVRHHVSMRILAYNEFFVGRGMLELVAAHILPNHPAVVPVMREAGALLEAATGDSSLQGYQSGSERATLIGKAIYDALRNRRIGYINPPASFENTGQKIRTPDQVLEEGLGTCLDLACTYAACLEQAGLHPLMYFKSGHAYAGFLTDEEIALPDASTSEHAISLTLQDAGLALPIETVGYTDGDDSPFEKALAIAKRSIEVSDANHALVDIRRARREGIHPLPVRVREGGNVTVIVQQPSAPSPASPPTTTAPTRIVPRSTSADRTPPRMRQWKAALLDMSFRNPLLHLRSGASTLNLAVASGGLGLLENLLMEGQAIRLLAHDELTAFQQSRGARRAADIDATVRVELLKREQVMFVETAQDALRRRCRSLMTKAREAEEENGTNILHLSLGSLIWTDPKTSREVRSPVLLMPVRLRSAGRGKPMELVADPTGGTAANHCLLHKLKVTFDLAIPELQQLEADSAGVDVDRALAGLRVAIARQGLSMRVDEDSSLALLQFGKFRMWKDLDDHWERFLAHPVIQHLVETPGETFAAGPPLPAPEELDKAEVYCPIPCDGTQLEAIVAAARGASFVLEGPPGTGKSQTITNLIANAVANGRRVLFVAEKRAALNVVKNRLSAVGLGPFCLDIHGKDSNPKQLREQLNASLDAHFTYDDAAWRSARESLTARSQQLRTYVEALHRRGPFGMSAWEARDALLQLGPGEEIPIVGSERSDHVDRIVGILRELPAVMGACAPVDRHPWRQLRAVPDMERLDRTRLRDAISTLQQAIRQIDAMPATTASLIATARTSADLEILEKAIAIIGSVAARDRQPVLLERLAGSGGKEMRQAVLAEHASLLTKAQPVLKAFTSEIFALDTDAVARQVQEAEKAFFLFRKGRITEALQPVASALRDTSLVPADAVRLLNLATSCRFDSNAVSTRVRDALAPVLSSTWTPWRPDARADTQHAAEMLDALADCLTDSARAAALTAWMAADVSAESTRKAIEALTGAYQVVHALLADAGAGDLNFPKDIGLVEALRDAIGGWNTDGNSGAFLNLRRWSTLLSLVQRLDHEGYGQLARDLVSGLCSPADAQRRFARGIARAALIERCDQPILSTFDGLDHSRFVQDFIELQEQDAAALRSVVPSRLLGSRPFRRGERFGEVAELARNELARQKGGLGIRGLLRKYARAVHELTPCFLMSPDSVAQYIEPGALEFDLVVFDEASQVPVGDAIGAIARGRALVVVGDSRQMPPTSFFGGSGSDAEAPEDATIQQSTEDLESILSECVASGLPRVWLSWHYRSQDEALIAFSNSHYYDGRLSSFPPPSQSDRQAGVRWRRVHDGIFDRGNTRTNYGEARAVVAEIRRLLADPATRGRSVGVVTFNIEQAELVTVLLEEASQEDALLAAALKHEDPEDRLFVKNLESVQGDERDIILMSVGFGRDRDGRMPMNFGPLNRPGGERRWNVAVTRARLLLIVFSSFDPEDIALDRIGVGATGVRHLRAYLEMARDGVQSVGTLPASKTGSNRHQDDVASALRETGLVVTTDIGLSNFRVDLAVAHPEAPDEQLLAVLLDGPGYAARRTVQDRDGLPVGVLQNLMRWPATHRIWMLEWLAEPQRVLADIKAKVDVLHLAKTATPGASAPMVPGDQPSSMSDTSSEVSPQIDAPAFLPKVIAPEALLNAPLAGRTAVASQLPIPAQVATRDEIDQDFHAYESPGDLGTRDDLEALTGSTRMAAIRAVHEVLAVEAPIEIDRLARLVARRFGLARVRQARLDQIKTLVPREQRHAGPFGEFVWTAEVSPDTWNVFRRTPAGIDRPLEEVPAEEIRNALVYFARKGMSISEEGALQELAMVYDIQRLTAPMRQRVQTIIAWAVERGDLRWDGDRLVAAPPA